MFSSIILLYTFWRIYVIVIVAKILGTEQGHTPICTKSKPHSGWRIF